ncbi:MAG: HlyD family efflux transporter periplasmic adaptor subunit [Pedosphaera sp.]|nr:HlyD family efflux transporter periplasmic adaptor subunit [Pedosphaera sp.]
MTDLSPIPIPAAQRWREFRIRIVPVIMFLATVSAAAWLWTQQVPTTVLVGEVEPVNASVSCHKSGVLADLNVSRLQHLKAGDRVAQVIIADPRVLQSSLAVILAEIQLLKVNLEPLLGEQRYALAYDRLRLDWMEQRVVLTTAQTRLQLAESEFRRAEQLFKQQILSEQLYDQARITKERLEAEIKERTLLISEQQKNLAALQLREPQVPGSTNALPAQSILQASIHVQEEKLRLTEAEMSPISLYASIDGVVSSILRRSGESVMAGESIVTITSGQSDKIVAYVRQPFFMSPKQGMSVEVRTRSFKHEIAEATVLNVGVQLEPIKATLLSPGMQRGTEMGLPLLVSLPKSLNLISGEIVDLRLRIGRN